MGQTDRQTERRTDGRVAPLLSALLCGAGIDLIFYSQKVILATKMLMVNSLSNYVIRTFGPNVDLPCL